MTAGARSPRWRSVLALAWVVVSTPATALDDVAGWIGALHSGGMQPAEEAITALAKAGERAVPSLAEVLASGTALERHRACAALAGMNASVGTAVEPLVTASADPEVEVRLAAVEGLGQRVATSDASRSALERRLADADPNVRVRAAAWLASSGTGGAGVAEPVLLGALRGEPLAPRVAALAGLAQLGAGASGEAVVATAAALGDPLAPVRGAAVVALASQRPRDVATVAALCPRLADPDEWVATGTARVLAVVDAPVAACAADLLGRAEAATARRAAWLLHARAAHEPAAAAAIAAHSGDADPVVRGYAQSAAWLIETRERSPARRTGRVE